MKDKVTTIDPQGDAAQAAQRVMRMMEALEAGKITPSQANAISLGAGKLLSYAKGQQDYAVHHERRVIIPFYGQTADKNP